MIGLGVPSKTYNILSAGKPILYIGDINSEIGLLIKENNLGYIAEPGNVVSISEGIKWYLNLSKTQIKTIKTKCRNVILERFSKEKILKQYSRII